MRLKNILISLSLVSAIFAGADTICAESPASKAANNKRLVWSEEFNIDGAVDTTVWNFETGFVRNHEEQWYQPQNALCKDGLLIIECRKESRPNPGYSEGSKEWRQSRPSIDYTSASVNTRGKKEFKYGSLEVRARIPVGPGAWPAIWTLGVENEWPSNGEIDVMEYYRIDGVPHILANAAWGSDRRFNAKWNSRTVPFSHFSEKDPDWASKFHIWRMDWDENFIKIYLDGELINSIDLSTTENPDGSNPMRQPHYVLLNLALGGDNGGFLSDDAFPLRYEVDYVRIYQ